MTHDRQDRQQLDASLLIRSAIRLIPGRHGIDAGGSVTDR
jgi:hypothetical protein